MCMKVRFKDYSDRAAGNNTIKNRLAAHIELMAFGGDQLTLDRSTEILV